MSRNQWNPDRETMSKAELREYQNEKLTNALARGYNNAPLIRNKWDQAGITPDDISDVVELTKAPIFRKDEARQIQIETGDPYGGRRSLPWSELAENDSYVGISSGTTGVPTNVILTERDLQIAGESHSRLLWRMGLRPEDHLLVWSVTSHAVMRAYPVAAHNIGATMTQIDHAPMKIPKLIHALQYLDPTVVIAVSSPMIGPIKDHMAENNLDPKEVWESVEGVAFGGEPLLPEVRDSLEREWEIELFEYGGTIEPLYQTAECSEAHGRWLHLDSDYFFYEVVDVETEERVEPGERGEIVVSALSYEGMSHIRFGQEDVVEWERGECECGHVGTRIKILGRTGDLVQVEDQYLLPADLMPTVHRRVEMPNNLFQFYTDSDEELQLKVGYDTEATDRPDAFSSELRDQLQTNLEVPVKVEDTVPEAELLELGPPHKIPRVTDK